MRFVILAFFCPDRTLMSDFPIPCECTLKQDTIFITTAAGMMSGLGIKIIVQKDHFASVFFEEADNTPLFKMDNINNEYLDRIVVPAEKQRLTFLKKPFFNGNETL